ncbi:hypothetical protein BC828DRAFT_381300 [Blastocladiella britannica]|nr:hypothetical protein BC828DRAFT_381300 [Blastocladiella britannica]
MAKDTARPFSRNPAASSSSRRGGNRPTASQHAFSSSAPQHQQNSKRPRAVAIKDGVAIRKPVAQLKADIRMTQRLLAKKRTEPQTDSSNGTHSTLMARLETKIAVLTAELERTKSLDKSTVDKFDQMYRSVKFMERQKASRRITKLWRAMAAAQTQDEPAGNTDDALPLERQLRDAELDLAYVMHFPAASKYVALWPTSETTGDAAKVANDKRRAEVRAHIAKLIDFGAINLAETVGACCGKPGESKEKKKTKKKGETEEEVKHKVIGNMLRGVVSSSEDEDEDQKDGSDSSDSSDSDSDSESESDPKAPGVDGDDFFM